VDEDVGRGEGVLMGVGVGFLRSNGGFREEAHHWSERIGVGLLPGIQRRRRRRVSMPRLPRRTADGSGMAVMFVILSVEIWFRVL
jgi:hypothetical protein